MRTEDQSRQKPFSSRGLDRITVSENEKKYCVLRIFLQRLPTVLTLALFGIILGYPLMAIIGEQVRENPIFAFVLFINVAAGYVFVFSFTQRDNVKLLTGDFNVYGAMCVWRKDNPSNDANDGFRTREQRRQDQNAHGFFIRANAVELACRWESYKHTQKGRYMYVIEVNRKKTWHAPEYYFINAPRSLEERRCGEYFPE